MELLASNSLSIKSQLSMTGHVKKLYVKTVCERKYTKKGFDINLWHVFASLRYPSLGFFFILDISVVLRETTLTFSGPTETGSPV